MRKILLTLALASSFGTVFAQNLLTNGSFETETAAGSSGNSYYMSATKSPDAWGFVPSTTATGSIADSSGLVTPYGSWFINLGASGGNSQLGPAQPSYDSLTQSVTTIIGATYDLSYYLYSPNSISNFYFNATWDNTVITGTQKSVYINTGWTQFTETVTGTGLDKLGLNGWSDNGGGYLDNVSLVQAQAVPEPKSLVLSIGVGIVTLTALRRRRA